MFRSTLILFASITLCLAETLQYPVDLINVPPLPKIRANPERYRLPGGTTPTDYVVVLKVDPNQRESFWGSVNINITADRADDRIVLHANPKNITSIAVKKSDGSDIYDSHSLSGLDTHFLNISLKESLEVDQIYSIDVEFYGSYGRTLHGLYLSSYLDSEGARRYLATTQFEPVNARDAFPCYDEPGLKAVFQINIYVPTGYHAVCNTDVTNSTTLPPTVDGLNLYAFEPTVKMSSYLIAYVISDFDYKSNLDEGQQQWFNKTFRVFSNPNLIKYGDYAVDFGQKSVAALEKFTDVKYALSKLDNFAIPDFSAGAMENWGLITYREPYLLYQPGTTTTRSKQSISTVMSHENTHMWFGNEVSPAWWDYLWLSEGFATYFEHYATDQAAPEWRMMDQYLSSCVYRAMSYDSRPSTNAMTSSVASPMEINNNFNTIAYQKSGSVIRMMEHILGSSNFQRGLQFYLKSIPKGNGEPRLLFEGLQRAVENITIFPPGITVSDVFGIWSTTPGFPILFAKKSVGDRSITLKQERYYQDKSIAHDGEKWWIPITWATSHEQDFEDTSVQDWFPPDMNEHDVEMNLRDNAWYILNKQATGYFRIMYDEHNWELLGKALNSDNFSGIHLLNRVQLIDDSLEFARTLRLSYNVTFDILNYLQEEVDYIPWLAAYPGITFLNAMMPAAKNYDLYLQYVRRMVQKAYDSVGFEPKENETPDIKMNRVNIMNVACTSGIVDCRQKASDLLGKLLANSSLSIDVDLRAQIYCGGMRSASSDLWQSFWNVYETSSSSSEKSTILRNLACSEDDDILKNYLAMAISPDTNISNSDKLSIIENTAISGAKGVDNVLNLVTQNFTQIKTTLSSTSAIRIINTLQSRVVSEAHYEQFKTFGETYDDFSSAEKLAVNQAIKVMEENREWLEDVLYDVDPWLIDNVK